MFRKQQVTLEISIDNKLTFDNHIKASAEKLVTS